jgi:hypothetical protein
MPVTITKLAADAHPAEEQLLHQAQWSEVHEIGLDWYCWTEMDKSFDL